MSTFAEELRDSIKKEAQSSNNIDIEFVDKIIKKRILYSHSCLNIYIIKEMF